MSTSPRIIRCSDIGRMGSVEMDGVHSILMSPFNRITAFSIHRTPTRHPLVLPLHLPPLLLHSLSSMSSPSAPPYYLITGSAGGVGFETACALASTHHSVIVTARSQTKADDAVRRIQQRFPSKSLSLLAMPLDLCDLSSIEGLVAALTERHVALRCVICNAGAATGATDKKVWGLPFLWVNNFLGHYHLVRLLMPNLQKTSQDSVDMSAQHITPHPPITTTTQPSPHLMTRCDCGGVV